VAVEWLWEWAMKVMHRQEKVVELKKKVK